MAQIIAIISLALIGLNIAAWLHFHDSDNCPYWIQKLNNPELMSHKSRILLKTLQSVTIVVAVISCLIVNYYSTPGIPVGLDYLSALVMSIIDLFIMTVLCLIIINPLKAMTHNLFNVDYYADFGIKFSSDCNTSNKITCFLINSLTLGILIAIITLLVMNGVQFREIPVLSTLGGIISCFLVFLSFLLTRLFWMGISYVIRTYFKWLLK